MATISRQITSSSELQCRPRVSDNVRPQTGPNLENDRAHFSRPGNVKLVGEIGKVGPSELDLRSHPSPTGAGRTGLPPPPPTTPGAAMPSFIIAPLVMAVYIQTDV